MPNQVKDALEELARSAGSDWIGEMFVWLGNTDGTVETGTPGLYYARYGNAQVVSVKNAINAPPIFDLHVRVRRSRIQPNIWQITDILEDYDAPAAQGGIASHHEQHEEEGYDRLNLDRKQIKQLSCRAAGGWIVQVSGDITPIEGAITYIPNQTIDLSAYIVAFGAIYLSLEVDNTGTITPNAGVNFGSPLITDPANIPIPDPGKYLLAWIRLYEGQVEITDPDIRVPMAIPGIGKNTGIQISEAAADTPLDADLFGFWDSIDLVLKSITFANFKATLKTYFDTIYSALGHTHSYLTDAPSDGEVYGRKDSAWVLAQNIGHSHGLVRWAGAIGDTTFDFPDYVSHIESVSINGEIADPTTYSLGSDNDQLILDSALGSAYIVTSNYILASL